MNPEPERPSIYPSVSRGSLSEDHQKYIHPVEAKGPHSGDMQKKVILFGVIFFVIFTILMAVNFGLLRYF